MTDVEVRIPTMLAGLVGGSRSVPVSGETVSEVLEAVFAVHPELRIHVLDETGSVRPHVAVFNDGAMIRGLDEAVGDGAEITVLQAVSGG